MAPVLIYIAIAVGLLTCMLIGGWGMKTLAEAGELARLRRDWHRIWNREQAEDE